MDQVPLGTTLFPPLQHGPFVVNSRPVLDHGTSHHRQRFCLSSEGWGPLSANAVYLTPCFVDGTIAIAAVIAFIFAIGAVIYLSKHAAVDKTLVGKLHFTAKLVTIVAIIGTTLAQTVLTALQHPGRFLQDVSFWSLVAVSISLFAIFCAQWLENYRSLCENAVVLTYWLIFVLIYTVKAITLALNPAFGPRSAGFILHYVTWALAALELILEYVVAEVLLAKRFEGNGGKSPVELANVFSDLLYTWLSPFMTFGYSNIITAKDLLALHPDDVSGKSFERFESVWVRAEKKNGKPPSVWIVMAKAFGAEFIVCGITEFLDIVFWVVQPLILQYFILWVASRTTETKTPQPYTWGLLWAFLMFSASFLRTVVVQKNFSQMITVSTRVQAAFRVKLYHKSMRLSSQARSAKPTGDIVNTMSVDAQKLWSMVRLAHWVWSLSVKLVFALLLLYRLLGWSMLAGVALMIFFTPANAVVTLLYKRFQVKQMKAKDNRTRLMSEIIENMKAIKLYTWDSAYEEKLRHVRHDEELKAMRAQSLLSGSFNILFSMPRYLIAACSFGVYVIVQKQILTTDIVFTSIAVFNMLNMPLAQLPMLIGIITEGVVSTRRFVEVFNAEELQPDAVTIGTKSTLDGEGVVVAVEDAAFTPGSSSSQELINITKFTCQQDEFCCIIGPVGSGKSSFLSGLLGQLYKVKGNVRLDGTVAYVPQTAWIMNASIKENILFGCAWDSDLYQRTLKACALNPDLKSLADGDATEVGERGIALSGGQKARLSLARAVYSQADIYLIDDCLAAVDEHVGKHLIQQVLGPNGILQSKARILATNSTRVLKEANAIYYLQEGKVTEQGTWRELMGNTESETSKLVNLHLKQQGPESSGSGSQTPLISLVESEDSSAATSSSEETKVGIDLTDVKKLAEVQAAQAAIPAAIADTTAEETIEDATEATPLLIDHERDGKDPETSAEEGHGQIAKAKVEKSEKGRVLFAVYKKYASACGHYHLAAWFAFMIASQGGALSSGLWIRYWTEKNSEYGGNYRPGLFIGIYTAIGLVAACCAAGSSIFCYAICRIRASKKLHDGMAAAIFRAPLSFFETTPAGQILNRFSSDIAKVDGEIIGSFTEAMGCLTYILFTLAVVCWTSPLFLLLVAPMGYICAVLQQYYVRTSRELSRLDSSSKSPVFSHFQESLAGVNTIRAYRKTGTFEKENGDRIDKNLSAWLIYVQSNRWVTLRLEFLGSIIVGGAAGLAVAAMAMGYKVSPGAVGLALSYALSVSSQLMWMVRSSSQIENNLVAVERVLEYTALPPEAPRESSAPPPTEWPTEGAVEFQNYSARYRPGLPLVLHDLTLSIPAGSRVGIVGRTGAGKSTLALALFRIIEPVEGTIRIDNIDTSLIGLGELRPRLSIIPQDSAILAGTVRQNLDPASAYTDEQLWAALAQAQLKAHVESMDGDGLDAKLQEGGSNLSQGQRQLIGLARALLASARVLVLDEATSAVDYRTDAVVQETLRGESFKDRTVLTVAHRINTIVDSDYIVVLDRGRAVEFDTPQALVAKGGLFKDLVVEAGLLGRFSES